MYFKLRQNTANQWSWSLHSANHENIAYGETYWNRVDAEHAINLVKGAPANGCQFGKGQGADRQWYWNLRATNGEIIARGEGYATEWGAKNAIALVAGTNFLTPVLTPVLK